MLELAATVIVCCAVVWATSPVWVLVGLALAVGLSDEGGVDD